MRMRWFGEPWPSADLRAPICDDDRYRVEPPLGHPCLGCGSPILGRERGILMAASMEIDGAFTVTLQFPGDGEAHCAVVAEHIDCLVRTTTGDPNVESLIDRVPR